MKLTNAEAENAWSRTSTPSCPHNRCLIGHMKNVAFSISLTEFIRWAIPGSSFLEKKCLTSFSVTFSRLCPSPRWGDGAGECRILTEFVSVPSNHVFIFSSTSGSRYLIPPVAPARFFHTASPSSQNFLQQCDSHDGIELRRRFGSSLFCIPEVLDSNLTPDTNNPTDMYSLFVSASM